jgi:hypothetical protein
MSVYLCMVPFTWILNFCMALMGNSSCFTALSEVTTFNWQLTMFYDTVSWLSSSSFPPFDALSTCGQASAVDFRNLIRFYLSQIVTRSCNFITSICELMKLVMALRMHIPNTSVNRSMRRGPNNRISHISDYFYLLYIKQHSAFKKSEPSLFWQWVNPTLSGFGRPLMLESSAGPAWSL